ncbi:hypothetical protein ABWK22_02835 [Gottfriedia acidiceleris]|uniref:hypothetical protein n=1 Tax=Gottfriedia acidiceleris TaxID=371036 RepID=UPI00339A0734
MEFNKSELHVIYKLLNDVELHSDEQRIVSHLKVKLEIEGNITMEKLDTLCDACGLYHTNYPIFSGEYVFSCQLLQAGFTEAITPEAVKHSAETDGLSTILQSQDNKFYEFNCRGNDWFSYVGEFKHEDTFEPVFVVKEDVKIGDIYWCRTISGNDYQVKVLSLPVNNIYKEPLVSTKSISDSSAPPLLTFVKHLYTRRDIKC